RLTRLRRAVKRAGRQVAPSYRKIFRSPPPERTKKPAPASRAHRGPTFDALLAAEFVRPVLMGALEIVEDRRLGVLGQGVQDLTHPGLAPRDRFALRHARRRDDLRRHALDLLDTTGVVTRIDHGLLFGHGGLVLFLRHADRPDAAAVEELSHDGLVAGQ